MAAMLTWVLLHAVLSTHDDRDDPNMFTLITMITGTLALLVICLASRFPP